MPDLGDDIYLVRVPGCGCSHINASPNDEQQYHARYQVLHVAWLFRRSPSERPQHSQIQDVYTPSAYARAINHGQWENQTYLSLIHI